MRFEIGELLLLLISSGSVAGSATTEQEGIGAGLTQNRSDNDLTLLVLDGASLELVLGLSDGESLLGSDLNDGGVLVGLVKDNKLGQVVLQALNVGDETTLGEVTATLIDTDADGASVGRGDTSSLLCQ